MPVRENAVPSRHATLKFYSFPESIFHKETSGYDPNIANHNVLPIQFVLKTPTTFYQTGQKITDG